MTDGKKIKKDREMYVIKSNELVRARYNLSLQQQKIVLYAISKIKPNDKPGKWYEISIEDLCAACGLEIDAGGFYYRTIKKDLQELTTRLWVKFPDREATVAWISDAEIVPLSGKVHIRFHEKMEEHLFWLQSCYTQYKLGEVLSFHNKYAIRLYEILRSYITREEIESGAEQEKSFSVDELREMMKIDTYNVFAEFERNVLRKAVAEINKYSDVMRLSYDLIRRGKSVTRVNFIITRPKATEIYHAHENTRQQLNRAEGLRKKREAQSIVTGWIQVHPKGKKRDCIEETGLSKYLVSKYWAKETEKKIQDLKGRISNNDKRLADMRAIHEHLQKKHDELIKLLTEDAPEMAKELLTKAMIATGEERDAAQAEYEEFMRNLKTISDTWRDISPEIEETMREGSARNKQQAAAEDLKQGGKY